MNLSIFASAIALCVISWQPLHAASASLTHSLEGFEQPESVLADPDGTHIYISNINGSPLELNGNGYITRLNIDGTQVDKQWASGFDAPKGLAVFENTLYIADMQKLHIVDTQSGKTLKSIVAKSSQMLNDISIDNEGVVYVSDLLGGGIYKYDGESLEKWFDSAELPHPNGLLIENNTLFIAGWGHDIQPDFTTITQGKVYGISLDDANMNVIEHSPAIGNLDGLVPYNDGLLVSDWINGNIFSVKNDQAELLFNAGKGSADIGKVGEMLYVPMMLDNRIDIYSLPQ